MMLRREFGAMIVAAMSTAALAACSGTSPTDPDGPLTLRVTTWTLNDAGIKDWWPGLIEAFEAEHENVTVEVEQIAFSDYVSTLTTRMTAGSPPDVLHVPLPTSTLPAWAQGGLLLPVSDWLATTDVPDLWPDSQDVFDWGGESYGILAVDYPFLLFYNERLLTDASVDVPTTPEELISAVETLSASDKFGFAVTADNSTNFIRDITIFLTGMGADWAEPGKWHWTEPAVVEAVDAWRTAAKHAPQGTDIATKRQAFLDGNVAMIIDGPYFLAQARSQAGPDAEGQLHVARVPFENTPGDVASGFSLPSEADPALLDTAKAFIEFAVSAEQEERYAELSASTVTRPGASDILAQDPEAAIFIEEHAAAQVVVPSTLESLRAQFADFMTIATPAFHELLDTDTPTADVLSELQSQLESADLLP